MPRESEADREFQEKRREPRFDATGNVRIEIEDEPGPFLLEGRLLDVSRNGFRAEHHHPGLARGQTVRFSHGYGKGLARVIWNRITGEATETGFCIL